MTKHLRKLDVWVDDDKLLSNEWIAMDFSNWRLEIEQKKINIPQLQQGLLRKDSFMQYHEPSSNDAQRIAKWWFQNKETEDSFSDFPISTEL